MHLTILRDPQVGEGSSQNGVWTLIQATSNADDQTDLHVFFVVPQNGALKVDVVQIHERLANTCRQRTEPFTCSQANSRICRVDRQLG
jgi:hypothetical protein